MTRHFTDIRAARRVISRKVNLIGVVVEHGFPRVTKGSDLYYGVRIMDDTDAYPGLPVQVFFAHMHQSPHVLHIGDIMLFSNVKISGVVWGELSGVFNKQFSSFALYDGKVGNSPYQKSELFRENDLDIIRVLQLRTWFWNTQHNEGANDFLFSKNLREGEDFDLFCKVLHVHKHAGHQWTAYVWDGTDAPPCTIVNRLLDEMHDPLALSLESFPLERNILFSFPTVGTVLRMVVEEIEPDFLPSLDIGKWIKLGKLKIKVDQGLWCIVLTQYSRIRYTRCEDPQRLYEEERLTTNPISRMPFWSLPWPSDITEVDADDHSVFHTLMDVVTGLEGLSSYKCAVRVVAISPCRAEDYLFPAGIRRIRLTLEDPTTRIHAFLYAENGMEFFDGPLSVEEINRKRNCLLGASVDLNGLEVEDTPRNPPWLQIRLRLEYEIDGDPEYCYRVFGTVIRWPLPSRHLTGP